MWPNPQETGHVYWSERVLVTILRTLSYSIMPYVVPELILHIKQATTF